jgi:hypothetical protein
MTITNSGLQAIYDKLKTLHARTYIVETEEQAAEMTRRHPHSKPVQVGDEYYVIDERRDTP